MSLGFLTESALVPSKAKAIQVDSKSIVDLKALVFRKEKERQERKQHFGTNSDTRKRFKTTNWKLRKEAQSHAKIRKGNHDTKGNRNIKDRQLRDEAIESEERMKDDVKVWEEKSRCILERKARLYDAMSRGHRATSEQDQVLLSECLVDFKSKSKTLNEDDMSGAMELALNDEYVTILDEFGRSRKLKKESKEYLEYVEATKKSKNDMKASDVDHSSFVVSQWERRLRTDEKQHLEEIHQSVRKAHSNITDRKANKRKRLEKLYASGNDTLQTDNDPLHIKKDLISLPVASEESGIASKLADAFLEDLLAK